MRSRLLEVIEIPTVFGGRSMSADREKSAQYQEALRAQIARRNRAESPEAAAFVDAVRACWPDAKVTYYGPARPRFDPRFDSYRSPDED